jgi:hypothetical protein
MYTYVYIKYKWNKDFLDKQKLREFVANRPKLQEIFTDVL